MPPLTGFQNKCVALMNSAPRAHATHCFRSALHHIERAELLREVDPAMAMFRAITAEEEAASGVMRCLIDMDYPAAGSLNPHDHAHKHAIFPFMRVLGLFFGQTLKNHFANFNLQIKEVSGATRLTLVLNVTINGEPQLAYPIPPLNFGAMNSENNEAPDFSLQINQLVAANGKASVKAFLKHEANLRNEILYASSNGYPTMSRLDIDFLVERRARVMAMINLYLMIFPYQEHQPFVTHALRSLVNLLQQLKRSRSAA